MHVIRCIHVYHVSLLHTHVCNVSDVCDVSLLRTRVSHATQVAAERLELKQQMQDIDISRIKRERQRAVDMRHAFRAAEERLRSSIKHRGVELQQRRVVL